MSLSFHTGIENFPKGEPGGVIATVGTFDGIHLGHQEIFHRVQQQGKETGLRPVIVTFHPHPRVVVNPNRVPQLLTTIEEKEQFIPHFFDGDVLTLDFDEALKQMTAEDFIKEILIDKVGISRLIVGYDHALGKDRGGTIDALNELGTKYGFELEVAQPVLFGEDPVSSSRIREAMTRGDYAGAIEMLGHYYAIYGTVERGIGLGRKLGYPTANVCYNQRKLLPPQGVYSCRVHIDADQHDGMMFIGQNHFNPHARISVEANIFDFDEDIYDRAITVYPVSFLRENRRFDSKEELIEQIVKDKEIVLSMIVKGEKTCHQ